MYNEFTLLESGHTVCGPDWGMKDEKAPFYRMYYILGGTAFLNIHQKLCPLEKGCFYILPVMTPYTLSHDPKDPLEVLWFHADFPADFRLEFGVIPVSQDSPLFFLLKALDTVAGQPLDGHRLLPVFDAFLSLLRDFLSIKRIQDPDMLSVLSYMEAHLSRGISVKELAAFAGMERSYFSRRFRTCFSLSPHQYLLSLRMHKACAELLNGSTVSQCSQAAGYSDEKSFSRAFRTYMHMSPSQYRKSHKLQP